MFGEENNLKDTSVNPLKDTVSAPVPYQSEGLQIGSYLKTDKLIAALYMVTDIMDKEEPLRNKLRMLGTEILSDAYSLPGAPFLLSIEKKITEVLSFLNIASSVHMITEMNASILKKEFCELKWGLKEYTEPNTKWLEKFIFEEPAKGEKEEGDKGHGVSAPVRKSEPAKKEVKDTFDHLKRHRREEIIKVIKANPMGITITDIRSKAGAGLSACGEKTLQRELVAMVHENVLKKMGDKRWSRYFLKP